MLILAFYIKKTFFKYFFKRFICIDQVVVILKQQMFSYVEVWTFMLFVLSNHFLVKGSSPDKVQKVL